MILLYNIQSAYVFFKVQGQVRYIRAGRENEEWQLPAMSDGNNKICIRNGKQSWSLHLVTHSSSQMLLAEGFSDLQTKTLH